MPIEWRRSASGVWTLRNTEEAAPTQPPAPDEPAPPTTPGVLGRERATLPPAADEEQARRDQWDADWKANLAKRSPEDHRVMRRRMRALKSDDPEQRHFAIAAMFNDGHIMANENDGGLYSRYRLNETDNQRLLDAAREYDDTEAKKAAEERGFADVAPPAGGGDETGLDYDAFVRSFQLGK